jgi:L-aminopeptidase/D-esterase-like protein
VPGAYNIAIMKAWIFALALIAATADLKVRTTHAFAPAASDVVQAFRPAVNGTLTAIPGIKVGHYTLAERPTGCTVVLIEQGATPGVDVRGAAPATRDTDLLNPTKPT